MREWNIGVVGPTSLMGESLLDGLLETEHFSVGKVRLFGSKVNVGKRITYGEQRLTVEELNNDTLGSCDIVFFTGEERTAQMYLPELAAQGTLCIDLSGFSAQDPTVPLAVAGVNESSWDAATLQKRSVVAIPHSAACILAETLSALSERFGIQRANATLLMSVSEQGRAGLDTLQEEGQKFFGAEDLRSKPSAVYPQSIAFNAIPEVHPELGGQVSQQISTILGKNDLKLHISTALVPVFVGLCGEVVVELEKAGEVDALRQTLGEIQQSECVPPLDPEEDEEFPRWGTPREMVASSAVCFSHIRPAPLYPAGVAFWFSCNNLRRGMISNALRVTGRCCGNGAISTRTDKT